MRKAAAETAEEWWSWQRQPSGRSEQSLCESNQTANHLPAKAAAPQFSSDPRKRRGDGMAGGGRTEI